MVQEAERKWEVEVITFHTRTVDIKKKKKRFRDIKDLGEFKQLETLLELGTKSMECGPVQII